MDMRWMDGGIEDGWLEGWMDKCVLRWMDERMEVGWMDGCQQMGGGRFRCMDG